MADEVSDTNLEMDHTGIEIPEEIAVGLLRKKIEDDQLTIARLEREAVLHKRDIEYLLSLRHMKDMGKKILGLREANRSLTRVLAKKEKVITRQNARAVDLLTDLAIIKETKCGDSYGSFPFITDMHCGMCRYPVRCREKTEKIKEKEVLKTNSQQRAETVRKAHYNGK